MRESFRDLRVKIADINAQVEDSVTGVRVVKAFGNEWYEAQKFDQGNARFKQAREKTYRVMAGFFSGINLFTNLFNVVVLLGGGLYVYYGKLTIGGLVGFLLYIAIFLQPVRQMCTLMEGYQKGMAGFRRFREIMAIEPDIADAAKAKNIKKVKGEIVFDQVAFSYNNRKNVLENINLLIKPGTTVAFVGHSGGGKTTLCSLIPRFYDVDQGCIRLDGTDIREIKLQSLRANIGFVQQDVFLFSATVRENIAYGKIGATDEEIVAAAKRAKAHEFIMGFPEGYNTYIGERGIKLSGGQKQRLAIARMFLKNPPIIILDEATAALDNETERAVQQALADLAAGRTTLMIAHRLTTIKKADKIVVLTEEGIVEQGSHYELLAANGVYARLYATQFDEYIPDAV